VGAAPQVPGFPWWLVLGIAGIAVIASYFVASGFADSRRMHG